MQVRWCGDCRDDRVFEVQPCEDGHGDDCLDLACVDCGSAVVVGLLVTEAPLVLQAQAA